MLDLAKETVLGLYALHFLALRTRMVALAEIARHGKVPARRMESILKKLRAAGLIRGRSGHGYALARPAASISVDEVARLLEPADSPKNCTERFDVCRYRESCSLAPLCRESWERTRSAMRSFTVADLRQSPPAPADCATPRRGATA